MKKILFVFILFGFILLTGCNPAEVTSAKVYLQQEDYSSALKQLRIAAEKYPDNAYAYNLLGQVYGELDSFPQMNDAFDRALELDSTYAGEINKWRKGKSQAAFNKGIKAAEGERWEKAIEYFETAAKADPYNADAYKNLAFIYTKQENPEKAIEANSRALEFAPGDAAIAIELTNLYIAQDDLDKALNVLETVEEKNDTSVFIKLQFARIYIEKAAEEGISEEDQKKLYEKTLGYLNEAETLQPNNADVLFSAGEICYQLKDYACASEKFDKYVKLAPEEFSGHYNLLLALSASERYEDAIKVGEIVTEKFPGSAEGWSRYGIALGYGKDAKEDKIMAAVSVSIGSGIIALEGGDTAKAIKEFKKADKPGLRERFSEIIGATNASEEDKQKVLDAFK